MEHVFAFPEKREFRTLFFFVSDTFSAATDLNVHSSGNVFCVLPDTLFIRLTPPTTTRHVCILYVFSIYAIYVDSI